MSSAQPHLRIESALDFSVAIEFSGVQRHKFGHSEYRFDVCCCVMHSKGEFAYTARSICFDPQTFRDFVGQLDAIRKGKAEKAEFREVGHMIDFSVEVRGQKTHASVRIREYQPNGQQTLLSASFQVDYDLFVNVLYRKAGDFVAELASMEPA